MAEQGFDGIGAWILGRNMFGPVRGPWPDDSWKGWWGDEPPYHTPVFVLTHYARAPLRMAGGTTFHFVTGGIDAALEQARAAAGDRDVRIGGGVATIRQYCGPGRSTSCTWPSAVLLGAGAHLLRRHRPAGPGYACAGHVAGERATHVFLAVWANAPGVPDGPRPERPGPRRRARTSPMEGTASAGTRQAVPYVRLRS